MNLFNINWLSRLFVLLIFPVLLAAQGLTGVTLGYQAGGYDAKTMAMQNIGVAGAGSLAGILINPAAAETEKLSLMITLGGFKLEEKRSFPVYDRFDGVVTKGTYVVNNHTYGNPAFVIQSGFFRDKAKGLTFGLYSMPFVNFAYDYKEYVRENNYGDLVIGFNKIHGQGLWWLNGINLQMNPIKKLQVGVNIGMINESNRVEMLVQTHFEDTSQVDMESFSSRKLDNSPVFTQFGAIYTYNERWTWGMQVQLPVNYELISVNPRKPFMLETAGDTTLSESFSRPLEISGGFIYRARTPFRTRLYMDYGYRFYSKVTQKIGSRSYENLNDTYYVGSALEFTYLHGNTFTFSYLYSNSPKNKSYTLSSFGLGVGIPIPHGMVEMATGFSKRQYRETDLFPDSLFGGDRTQSVVDEVVENFLFGKVSVVFNLK